METSKTKKTQVFNLIILDKSGSMDSAFAKKLSLAITRLLAQSRQHSLNTMIHRNTTSPWQHSVVVAWI